MAKKPANSIKEALENLKEKPEKKKGKKSKSDKPHVFVLEAALESALRRLFRSSIFTSATKNAFKVEVPNYNKDGSLSKSKRFMYRCSSCEELFPDKYIKHTNKQGRQVQKKAFAVDHTIPVVDPVTGKAKRPCGKTDWNVYIDRMFCDVQIFDTSKDSYNTLLKNRTSILCHSCHDKKTKEENEVRKESKKANKPKKEKKI